jgi:hypothetical protein
VRIPRPTVDIAVILLTATVGLGLLLMTVGLIVAKIATPAADVSHLSAQVGNMMQTILGALVGFIGGRAVGKSEARP